MKKGGVLLLLLLLLLMPEIGHCYSRSWYQKASVGGEARHRCTAFSIGNKGYYGGGHINSGTTATYQDYWEYDPATNSWTQIADFGGGPRYHSSAFTIGNAAYVGCGEDDATHYTKDFWKYVPEVNTWFPIADLPAIERRGGTAFAIDGKGYYGTGQSEAGYLTDFYVYDPESNVWTAVADFPGSQRSATVSFTLNAKGYVGTGHEFGFAVSDFYEYDPATNVWTAKASVGGSVRQDAMAFAIDGKGYIGLGNDNLGNDFKDIWEYDVETDTWTQIEDFGGQKRRYATTFVIDNIVYLVGGTDGTNFKDCWAYAPTVSILEQFLADVDLEIFPNPSTDIATITLALPHDILDKFSFSVTDMSGKKIVPENPLSPQIQLNKSQLGAGVFLINFSCNGVVCASKKLIFQ